MLQITFNLYNTHPLTAFYPPTQNTCAHVHTHTTHTHTHTYTHTHMHTHMHTHTHTTLVIYTTHLQTNTQNSTSVRSRLNDQLTKLQVKHSAEVDLLEDIKTFTKQRSLLEKQYAEVMSTVSMSE